MNLASSFYTNSLTKVKGAWGNVTSYGQSIAARHERVATATGSNTAGTISAGRKMRSDAAGVYTGSAKNRRSINAGMAGAALGGTYGAFSDDTSIVGGAAIGGVGAAAARMGHRKLMSQYRGMQRSDPQRLAGLRGKMAERQGAGGL